MIPNVEAKDLIDKLKINPFIDGPTEALVKAVAQNIASIPEFRYVFSDNIDAYERFDYSVRQLPALRVYSNNYRKEHESHYISGELILDVIYPADLRRIELQKFQDIISSAFLQHFRRPNQFNAVKELVPGLNELGKIFEVDKSLGMKWEEDWVPLTQMKANFRIDLKMWDAYLESTGRTKDDPFSITLESLVSLVANIIPVRDDNSQDTQAATSLTVKTQGD